MSGPFSDEGPGPAHGPQAGTRKDLGFAPTPLFTPKSTLFALSHKYGQGHCQPTRQPGASWKRRPQTSGHTARPVGQGLISAPTRPPRKGQCIVARCCPSAELCRGGTGPARSYPSITRFPRHGAHTCEMATVTQGTGTALERRKPNGLQRNCVRMSQRRPGRVPATT